MHLRLLFSVFQMEVLRILNVAPTELHPNSWGYIQVFVVICQELAIRPTAALFLHFFRTRLMAKRAWLSLSTELGNAILRLYAHPLKASKISFLECLSLSRVSLSSLTKMEVPSFLCNGLRTLGDLLLSRKKR